MSGIFKFEMIDLIIIDRAVLGDYESIDAFLTAIDASVSIETKIVISPASMDFQWTVFSMRKKYCNLRQFMQFRQDEFSVELVHKILSDAKAYFKLRHFAIVTHNGNNIELAYPNNAVLVDSIATEKTAKAVNWILSGFGKDVKMKSNTWFWADPHFNHANIIKYCNRPFSNVKEMNEALIANYNSVVGCNDTIWCLGDFCFGPKDEIAEIMSKLNGKIYLVKGNHDRHKNVAYLDAGFKWVYDRPVVLDDYIVLSHAPLEFLNRNSPFFNIAGHVHDSNVYETFSASHCIACVERHGYKPVSMCEIQTRVKALRNK